MITYGQCFARDGEFQIDPIWPIWTLKDPKALLQLQWPQDEALQRHELTGGAATEVF